MGNMQFQTLAISTLLPKIGTMILFVNTIIEIGMPEKQILLHTLNMEVLGSPLIFGSTPIYSKELIACSRVVPILQLNMHRAIIKS
jgi:hypothetical protein